MSGNPRDTQAIAPKKHPLALTVLYLLVAGALAFTLVDFWKLFGRTPKGHLDFLVVAITMVSACLVVLATDLSKTTRGSRYANAIIGTVKIALRVAIAITILRIFRLESYIEIVVRQVWNLRERAAQALSEVLSWVVSGFLGNLVYDLLKRKFPSSLLRATTPPDPPPHEPPPVPTTLDTGADDI